MMTDRSHDLSNLLLLSSIVRKLSIKQPRKMENNKSILFASFDYEQQEHRGITFYAKSLAENTHCLGYQNYLLTSAKTDRNPRIQQLDIHRQLEYPTGIGNLRLILKYLKSALIPIDLNYKLVDNNNPGIIKGISRLSYLENVRGYFNVSYIYDLISLHSRVFNSPYNLKLSKQSKIDIVFCSSPMNIRIDRPIKLVQTLHDIFPISSILHPPEDSAKVFYKRIENMMIHSDKVLSVSDFSRNQILKIFPAYEQKIVTTYQPIPIFNSEDVMSKDFHVCEALLNKYQLQNTEYLLFVSMLEKRKNILTTIEAYLSIKEQIGNIPLVIIGSLGYGSSEIAQYLESHKFNNSIRYLKYIPTIDKLVLLRKAKAFIFPSFYEGFGIPPLEAMQMGCPVLTSNISALPEICGDAALYVDPLSLSDIAKGIVEITNNHELRLELIARGYQNIKRFARDTYQDRLGKILSELDR